MFCVRAKLPLPKHVARPGQIKNGGGRCWTRRSCALRSARPHPIGRFDDASNGQVTQQLWIDDASARTSTTAAARPMARCRDPPARRFATTPAGARRSQAAGQRQPPAPHAGSTAWRLFPGAADVRGRRRLLAFAAVAVRQPARRHRLDQRRASRSSTRPGREGPAKRAPTPGSAGSRSRFGDAGGAGGLRQRPTTAAPTRPSVTGRRHPGHLAQRPSPSSSRPSCRSCGTCSPIAASAP